MQAPLANSAFTQLPSIHAFNTPHHNTAMPGLQPPPHHNAAIPNLQLSPPQYGHLPAYTTVNKHTTSTTTTSHTSFTAISNHYSSNSTIHDLAPHARSTCLLYTSPSPRDGLLSRMPSSA
jgi:hypothetical protein